MSTWGSEKEIETRRRILLSIWAYAYEECDDSLVDDHTFDNEAKKVNLDIDTDRPDLDAYFRKKFNAYTGMWVSSHPELDKIKQLYEKYYKTKNVEEYKGTLFD